MNYLKTFLPYLFGNKKGKSLDYSLPDPIPWATLNFEEILMFHTLKNTLNQYVNSLDLKLLNQKDIYQLFNFLPFLNENQNSTILKLFKKEFTLFNEAISAQALSKKEVQELLDFNTFKLSVFAILKKNRNEPGKIVIRMANGHFLSDSQNNIWSIPILGLSRRGLPFHHSNGNTPIGIFKLESVMPEANKQFEFGQFRRLIINFIKESPNEVEMRKYLPSNHQHLSWWKAGIVSREIGRSLLRIHGTGRKNLNPFNPYFPFVPTSGCLATSEAKLLGFNKTQDQRLLLDALMQALNLPPSSENESKIHGLLYVVELDDNLSALSF